MQSTTPVPTLDVSNYCYFTETPWDNSPMHSKYSHFDCSAGSIELDNGDWLVPSGGFCTGRCKTQNGFSYRMESSLARLTCSSSKTLGDISDEEFQQLLDQGFDHFSDPASTVEWGMLGDLWDAIENGSTASVSKCYKVTDTDCGDFPDYKGDESDEGVDWNCDDGFNAGSKCDKQCIGIFSYQVASHITPKTTTECYCKGTCKWLSNTTECKMR